MIYILLTDPIEKVALSVRSTNALHRGDVFTIAQLLPLTEGELKSLPNVGQKSADEILTAIAQISQGTGDYQLTERPPQMPVSVLPEATSFFISDSGAMIADMSIEELDLSVRASRCLTSVGITMASQLWGKTAEDLKEIKNMGILTVKEVVEQFNKHAQKTEAVTPQAYLEMSPEIQLCQKMTVDYADVLGVKSPLLFELLLPGIETYFGADTSIEKHKYESSPDLLAALFCDRALMEHLKSCILNVVNRNDAVSVSWLRSQFPPHLSAVISAGVEDLISDGALIQSENGIEQVFPTAAAYFAEAITDKNSEFVLARIGGQTLEQIAIAHGLTRERVRQRIAKSLGKLRPTLDEDRYKEVFMRYAFDKKKFCFAFQEPESTYNYLFDAYHFRKKELQPIEEMLQDTTVSKKLRKGVERWENKNYVFISGERVYRSRPELAACVARLYCKTEQRMEEFLELYQDTLDEIGLGDDERFIISSPTYENKLAAADYILWKQSKRLRYYPMGNFDFGNLLATLDLQQYDNVEYSTLKFYRAYPELMHEYDLRDEYELHNLLKKLCQNGLISNLHFGRMPMIDFGTANRKSQMHDILFQTAPCTLSQVSAAYEDEYGMRADTASSQFLIFFPEFFSDKTFSLQNYQNHAMTPAQLCTIGKLLTADCYHIKELRELCKATLPETGLQLVNAYNLRKMGYRVFQDFAISTRFKSAADYYRFLLTSNDVVDLGEASPYLWQNGSFQSELYRLRHEYDIVEFSPKRYIGIRRLLDGGISKSDLCSYASEASRAVAYGDFFTISSLNRSGFSHPLQELGFEDCFYASILTEAKERFVYQRMGSNKLFRKGSTADDVIVTLIEFVRWILEDIGSIDMYDLCEFILTEYGLSVRRDKIITLIHGSSMYYDPISEKAYLNYDEYFEEV